MERIFLLEDDEALGRGITMALEGPERSVFRAGTLVQACLFQGVQHLRFGKMQTISDGVGSCFTALRKSRTNQCKKSRFLLCR